MPKPSPGSCPSGCVSGERTEVPASSHPGKTYVPSALSITFAASVSFAPELGLAEIHIWRADLTNRPEPSALKVLSPAELEAAARYRSELARASFVHRRAALRRILGGYTRIAPREIEFATNLFGKPELAGDAAGAGISFSTSHSGSVALIAVGRTPALGIDIERLRDDIEPECIATQFFCDREAAAIAALPAPERRAAFFSLWTRKEAVVKALGGGLSIPLDAFEVSVNPAAPPTLVECSLDARWVDELTIHDLSPASGYVGALVTRSDASMIRSWIWIG
jgi:4'-phosphopantetheinyl transferase